MPNKIKPRRSYTANSVPLTTDLETHELAINWADGIAYTRNSAGQIVSVTLGGGGGGGSGLTWSSVPASATATGTAGSIAYDDASGFFYVATAANTWKRASLSTWTNFTPASVTGLQLWLDASDGASLYDATSGGSVVAADGAVARWEDKSNNGRHFTQGTSGNRPAWKASQQNGLSTILFDGANDVLNGPDFLDLDTGSVTAFFVYKRNATGVRHEILAKTDASGSGYLFFHGPDDKLSLRTQNTGADRWTQANTAASVAASGYVVVTMAVSSGSIAACAIRRNAAALSMATASQANGGDETPANNSGLLRLGAQEYAGDFYFPLNANVAEIAIYNAALSSTDRAAVESYLMTKWAIS